MVVVIVALFALFGLFIGSFLNVVVDRGIAGESFFKGRSKCDGCGQALRWFELIPLLSFIVQKGRCRRCFIPLSWRYPLSELVTAVTFGLVGYRYSPALTSISCGGLPGVSVCSQLALSIGLMLVFVAALVVITFVDVQIGIIPDKVLSVVLIAFCFVFISRLSIDFLELTISSKVNSLSSTVIHFYLMELRTTIFSALCAFLFFYLLIILTKGNGMGGGDAKLAFIIGLVMPGIETLLALYFSFVIGGIFGLLVLLTGKRRFGQTVPFGPFMALGAIVAWVWGVEMWALWFS